MQSPLPVNAGFSLGVYTGDMNHARAGGSAIGQDASTVALNPSAMTQLSDTEWLVSARYYVPSIKFTNKNSIDAIGQPLLGGNGGDGGLTVFAPGFYYTRPMENDWWLGIGLNAPFGLTTKYDSDWVGRYQSIESSIESVALNLSFAKKMSTQWSVGAGLFYQQAAAKLVTAVDFGSVCLGTLDAATCSTLGMPAPQSADGQLSLDGDDAGIGGLLGILYEAENYRIGALYRSKVDHELEASADFATPAGVAAFAPLFTDTTAKIDITLPEQLSLSAYLQLNSQLAVMADVTRTNWSRIKEIDINYSNSAQPNTTLPKKWEATTRVALGMDYIANDRWTIQAGMAKEESPIPDGTFEPGIPIAGISWYSLGAMYQATDTLAIDFGVTKVIVDDQKINISGATGETLVGSISSEMIVYGLRLNGSF